jgi:hypothetical protein
MYLPKSIFLAPAGTDLGVKLFLSRDLFYILGLSSESHKAVSKLKHLLQWPYAFQYM